MRPFVAGITDTKSNIPGLQVLYFWMRFPVASGSQRQLFYKAVQGSARPQAPDSNGGTSYSSAADVQELADFQNGLFFEKVGFDILDTTAGQSITDRLTRLYALAQAGTTSEVNTSNQFFGSYYDGSAWHVVSA